MTDASKYSLKNTIKLWIKRLQQFVDTFWYPPFLGLLAALDNLVIIIPNDGILISSVMLARRRWLSLALNVTIGSSLGALLLAFIVEQKGLPWILNLYPGIDQSQIWIWTLHFFQNYGLLLVFIVALTPVAQQPAVILASLAQTPLFELWLIVLAGRLIKFLIMAYIGSHAPQLLSRLWGLQGELKDVPISLNSENSDSHGSSQLPE